MNVEEYSKYIDNIKDMSKEEFINRIINRISKDYGAVIANELKYIIIRKERENNKQKEVLDKIRKNNTRIIDYGFDYDGFNNVEDLKKLIDMLVDYAKQNDELLEEIE